MLKKIKLSLIGVFIFVGLVGGVVAATVPLDSANAACGSFLTFPAWYDGLTDGSCNIISPQKTNDEAGINLFVWRIVLNVIEIVLQIIGYIAAFYIIYGGFIYMTSNGSPDRATAGIHTIVNASVGLVMGISAIAIKNLAWELLAGSGVADPNTTGGFKNIHKLQGIEVLGAVLQTTYFITGAVAVIVVIIAGLTYVTANRNPANVTKAKRMLTYGIIGLIVVAVASPLTTFIVGRF